MRSTRGRSYRRIPAMAIHILCESSGRHRRPAAGLSASARLSRGEYEAARCCRAHSLWFRRGAAVVCRKGDACSATARAFSPAALPLCGVGMSQSLCGFGNERKPQPNPHARRQRKRRLSILASVDIAKLLELLNAAIADAEIAGEISSVDHARNHRLRLVLHEVGNALRQS
jgi:hypothetical protein